VTAAGAIYGLGTIASATLNAANSFTVNGAGISVLAGALTISGGTFLVQHGEIDLNGAVSITNNALVQIQNGATAKVAGGISGTGISSSMAAP
jgi:hypothetical protein